MKSQEQHTFYQRYYTQLRGHTIVTAGVRDEGGQLWPYFELDNGTTIEVSCDPEGNGPGFLFGLPRP